MGILQKPQDIVGKFIRKRNFTDLCKSCNLALDYSINRDSFKILKDIFYSRCYSGYFPFYQTATILDIGAHKGYFSLFAALHTNSESNIISMEPCEENYNVLVSNLKANNIRNVETIKAGIAAINGTADMFVSRSWNNSLFKQYGEILDDTKAPQAVTIEVYSLREILDRYHLDHVDFMKLDCEGAEYPALFGADAEALCRIRTISMEFHDIRDPRYTGLSVVEVLRDQGFRVVHFNYSPTHKNLNFGKIVATRL